MVEYAIVLACISAFGASFSDNLTNTLNGVFNKVTGVITGAESDSKKGSLENFMDNIANEPDFMKLLYSAVNFNSSQDISKWNSNAQVLMGDKTGLDYIGGGFSDCIITKTFSSYCCYYILCSQSN